MNTYYINIIIYILVCLKKFSYMFIGPGISKICRADHQAGNPVTDDAILRKNFFSGKLHFIVFKTFNTHYGGSSSLLKVTLM